MAPPPMGAMQMCNYNSQNVILWRRYTQILCPTIFFQGDICIHWETPRKIFYQPEFEKTIWLISKESRIAVISPIWHRFNSKPLPRLKSPGPSKMAEQTKSLEGPFIKEAFLFQTEIYAKRTGRKSWDEELLLHLDTQAADPLGQGRLKPLLKKEDEGLERFINYRKYYRSHLKCNYV